MYAIGRSVGAYTHVVNMRCVRKPQPLSGWMRKCRSCVLGLAAGFQMYPMTWFVRLRRPRPAVAAVPHTSTTARLRPQRSCGAAVPAWWRSAPAARFWPPLWRRIPAAGRFRYAPSASHRRPPWPLPARHAGPLLQPGNHRTGRSLLVARAPPLRSCMASRHPRQPPAVRAGV